MRTPRLVVITILMVMLLFGTILASNAWGAMDCKLSKDEQAMIDLVNDARILHDRKALSPDSRLVTFARSYAGEMVAYDFFSHISPITGNLLSRIEKAGFEHWVIAGENLANAPSAEDAFEALMESPSHKANILDARYTCIGIGIVEGGDYGTMFVQEFIAYETQRKSTPGD